MARLCHHDAYTALSGVHKPGLGGLIREPCGGDARDGRRKGAQIRRCDCLRLVGHGVKYSSYSRSPTPLLIIDGLVGVCKIFESQRISTPSDLVSHPQISPGSRKQAKETNLVYYKSVDITGDVIPRHAYIHEPPRIPWGPAYTAPRSPSGPSHGALNELKSEGGTRRKERRCDDMRAARFITFLLFSKAFLLSTPSTYCEKISQSWYCTTI